jgi:hypothetical protein
MAYTVNKTDGTTLVVLQDGTIDLAKTDLALFGKGYAGFGERLNENFVKLLENFSNTTAPQNKIKGQLWYDSLSNQLNVYNGTEFKPVGSSKNSSTQPTTGNTGDTWFDTTNNQLYVYNGSVWTLIGPTSVSGSGVTQIVSDTVEDSVGVNRSILKMITNDIIVAIVSQVQFVPKVTISGFSTIYVGITLNTTSLSGAKLHGTSTNTDALDGTTASAYIKTTGGAVSGSLSITNGITFGASLNGSLSMSSDDLILENNINNGDLKFNVNSNSVLSTTALTIDGQTASVIVPNDLRVKGNLTVDGTQVIINTTTLSVEDNIIELNRNISNNAGMPNYSGLKVNRGVGTSATEEDLYWVWDETFADDGSTVYGNAGGAWTAFRSSTDNLVAPTLVDIRANIVHATSTSAQYADLAERYEADMPTEAGDVVILGGDREVTICKTELSNQVFGVVSEKPAFLMNKDAGNNDSHPMIALKGRVDVKVIGTGKKGDRIVSSSTPGVAKVANLDDCTPFNVLGRLLVDKYSVTIELVQCAIGVK